MIQGISKVLPLQTNTALPIKPVATQEKFGSFLKDAISELNNSQIQSDIMTQKLAKGENVELHQVMITSQKASISMSLAMEVRNKVVEAYQEVMRMPM